MLNIYVCDDEKVITESIKSYVEEYFIKYPMEYKISTFNTGKSFYQSYKRQKAEVVFLDIELGDSHGISIAKAIREFDKKVKIIFITSYKNYKGAAFSVRAFGYVDKPVTRKGIFDQLQDIIKYIKEEQNSTQLKFETMEGFIYIDPKEIIYFVNENRKIKIVTISQTYYMKQKISTLTNLLKTFHFSCPHASFLVNLDYVMDIRNYTVYLANDIEIPLSQRKSTDFHNTMHRFLQESIDICKE